MFKGYFFLLCAALFWGSTFVVQKISMDGMGPFTFTGIRFLIGGICLLVYRSLNLIVTGVRAKKTPDLSFYFSKSYIRVFLLLGLIVFVGINLQQVALVITTPTHAALITSTYVFFVPIFLLFLGEKIQKRVWFIGVIIFSGIFLLTVDLNNIDSWLGNNETNELLHKVNSGDLIVLVSAMVWAVHIISLERCLKKGYAPVDLVLGQSILVGIFSLGVAMIFEDPNWGLLIAHIGEFTVGGIFSVALAFLLQVKGQAVIRASIATLLLSTESLFAMFADYLWLDRILTTQAWIGAIFIMGGILLIQVWHFIDEKRESNT